MAQAEATITTIPSAPAQVGQTVHYIPEILIFSGSIQTGAYFPELYKGDTTKSAIIADVAGAHHENIGRVLAFDLAAGTCWDASKEIAYLVLDQVLDEYGRIPATCVDFLEEHLGIGVVARAERDAA